MKLLVIGSEGFIGKNSVNYFIKNGYDVTGCDLVDVNTDKYTYIKISRLQPAYSQIFLKQMFDVVICAAGSGSVPVSFRSPSMDFEANVSDIIMLLDTIREHNINCKIINISSAAVYGNPKTLPINENATISPLSPYGWHKYMSELVCREYHDIFKLQTCCIRPFSVYGPGLKKQIVWDIYQKMMNNNFEIELFGTGEETRDFVFIDDLISSIDIIIKKGTFNGEVYNLASGSQITIKKIASIIFDKAKYNGTLKFNEEIRQGDPRFWLADITKIKKLGYEPKTTIEDGLTKTIEWLQKTT
jgi:dTDP-glucose 4,6-dehydratase/UDP-glucose 4-epimerase